MAHLIRRLGRWLVILALVSPTAARAMPPLVAVIAIAGAAAAGVASVVVIAGLTVMNLIMITSMVYGVISAQRAKSKAARNAKNAYNDSLQDRTTTVMSADDPWQIIYGEAVVGGSIKAILTSGDKDQYKHVVVVWAAHECDGIADVMLAGVSIGARDANGNVLGGRWQKDATTIEQDVLVLSSTGTAVLSRAPTSGLSVSEVGASENMPLFLETGDVTVSGLALTVAPVHVPYWANRQVAINYEVLATSSLLRVRHHLGQADQAADALTMAEVPADWKASDRLRGLCYSIFRFDLNEAEFQGGPPQMTARVRGRKVFDHRTGVTAWSANNALCTADFLTAEFGKRALATQLDWASVDEAANACDEALASQAGARRFTCNGAFHTDQDPDATLDQLCQSMAGFATYTGGWHLQAGVYTAPVMDLGDADNRGSIEGVAAPAGVEVFNGIRGKFFDPARYDQLTDYPPYQNAAFVAEDGEPLWSDLPLPFTNTAWRAHNLARIQVERSRGRQFVYPAKRRALALRAGKRVRLSNSLMGMELAVSRVVKKEYKLGGAVMLTLSQDDPSFYDEVDAPASLPSPSVHLPNPWLVEPVQGLYAQSGTATLAIQADGTILSRLLVGVSPSTDALVVSNGALQIDYRRADVDTWQRAPEAAGDATRAYLIGLEEMHTYLVRARWRNGLGAVSEWRMTTVLHRGKSEPPGAVTDLGGESVSGGCQISWAKPADVDYGTTRLLIGATLVSATEIFDGSVNVFTWQYPIAGTYKCWAIHIDTSGNASAAVSADIEVGAIASGGGSVSIEYSINGVSGWHPVFADGDLFMRQKVGSGAWSGAIRIVGIKGDKGDAGLDGEGRVSARVLIYRRSASGIPSLPSALATLTFSTGIITGLNNGWTIDIPAGTDPCYVSAATASAVYSGSGTTATIAAVSWAGATLMVRNGDGGAAGLNNATVQVYRRTTTASAPAGISGTTTYTFANGLLTGALGAWYQVAPPASDGKYLWTQVATALSTAATDDIPSGEWSAVRLHVQDGETGASQYTLVPRANAVTAGSTAGKVGGANAWDSDVYSVQIYTGAAYAGARTTSTATHSMFGLSSNPLSTTGHDNLNYAIYFEAGTIWIYENGTSRGTFGAYTTASVMSIVYGGSTVRYYRDGVLLLTSTAATGQKLQFKATFNTPGASIDSIAFGPSGPDGLNALQLALSPPAASVLADSSGNVVSGGLAQAVTTAKVTDGQTDVTSLWTISRTNGTGITSNISGATITVTGMTVDTGEIIVTATRAGYTTQTARMGLTKVRSAAPTSGPVAQLYAYAIGVNASPGSPGVASVRIETNGQVSARNGPSTTFNVVAEYYTPPTANVGSSPGIWVKSTLVSGAATGGTFGTWVKLSAALTFTLSANSGTGSLSSSTKHTFATDAAGANVVGVLYADYTADYV